MQALEHFSKDLEQKLEEALNDVERYDTDKQELMEKIKKYKEQISEINDAKDVLRANGF